MIVEADGSLSCRWLIRSPLPVLAERYGEGSPQPYPAGSTSTGSTGWVLAPGAGA